MRTRSKTDRSGRLWGPMDRAAKKLGIKLDHRRAHTRVSGELLVALPGKRWGLAADFYPQEPS